MDIYLPATDALEQWPDDSDASLQASQPWLLIIY